MIFWNVTPCSIMSGYQPCRGRCCFQLEDKWKVNAVGILEMFIITHADTRWCNSEDHNLSNYGDQPSVKLYHTYLGKWPKHFLCMENCNSTATDLTQYWDEKMSTAFCGRTFQIKHKWRKEPKNYLKTSENVATSLVLWDIALISELLHYGTLSD